MMAQDKTEKGRFPEYWLYWTYQLPDLLPKQLHSTDGRRIDILERGVQNRDNGPDFLNAVIYIDGVCQRGDVEFHIHAMDWYRHGHDEDARYRNVILHLIWDSQRPLPALEQRFPHVELKPQIIIDEASWRRRMQILEGEAPIASPPAHLSGLDSSTLGRLAEQRFQRKADRLANWLSYHSAEDVLFIAMAEVFGYRLNKSAFRQLIWACPPSRMWQQSEQFLTTPLQLWLYLVLRSGLLPSWSERFLPNDAHHTFLIRKSLRAFHEAGYTRLLQQSDWHFSRLRPANAPLWRLAAYAQLLFAFQHDSLFRELLDIAMQRMPARQLLAAWRKRLRIPIDSSLLTVFPLLAQHAPASAHTIGESRFRHLVVNSLLPLLYVWASKTGNKGFAVYLQSIYEDIPGAQSFGQLNNTIASLKDKKLAELLRSHAFYQQGILEFYALHQPKASFFS